MQLYYFEIRAKRGDDIRVGINLEKIDRSFIKKLLIATSAKN